MSSALKSYKDLSPRSRQPLWAWRWRSRAAAPKASYEQR